MQRKLFLSSIAIAVLILTSAICIAQTPSTDLGKKASDLAEDVLGVPYLSGGQGWDNNNHFVDSSSIRSGYSGGSSQGQAGLDCSGLVYWTYNKAAGLERKPTGKYGECSECPIGWLSADGIGYEADKTKFISHLPKKDPGKQIHTEPPKQSDLMPGDLLFLDTPEETPGCNGITFGCLDHVGMYVGDGYVIHASGDNLIETVPKGSTGTIVDGPKKSADGKTWYRISYTDGTIGWSEEGLFIKEDDKIEITTDKADVRFTPSKKGAVTKLTLNQWLNLPVGSKTYRDYFAGYGRIQIMPSIKKQEQDSLKQLRKNGDKIPSAGVVNDRTVAFKAIVRYPTGKKVKLQVELRRLDEYNGQFIDSEGHEDDFKNSELVTSGSEATAYAYGLIDGNYHWRARAVGEDGIASQWVDFGCNDISEADFSVTETPAAVDALSIGIATSSSDIFGSATTNPTSLKGDIYYLPEDASSLPDFSSLTPVGSIYTNVLDIPERSFDAGFPGVTDRFEWFAIRYTGTFNIDQEGEYVFRLVSDDGSRLLIDGTKIIDNDGQHAVRSVSGEVYLTHGLHSLEVDYFQGPRAEIALQLFWTPPGGSESICNLQYLQGGPQEVATGSLFDAVSVSSEQEVWYTILRP